MPFTVGQTATNPKTGQKVKWDGANWVGIPGTASMIGAGSGGRGSQQDIKYLNDLSTDAAAAQETSRIYDRARGDVKALGTGPYHGTFVGAATPEDSGGILDKIGGVLLGAPARLLGAITPNETNAYQHLRGLQAQQVLTKQILQKGTQTEGDAARMMLTELSPTKTPAVNNDTINQGQALAHRVQARATFYTQWANKYGLHGMNPHGMTADEVWAKAANVFTQKLFGPMPGTQPMSDIRVISRTKVK